jgi:hypothetical protein
MKNSLSNILEKDKIWTKIKKYILLLITILIVLVLLLVGIITMQGITLKKITDILYTAV